MVRFLAIVLVTAFLLAGSGNATPFETAANTEYTLKTDRLALATVGPLLVGGGGRDGTAVSDKIVAIHPDLAPGHTVLGQLPSPRWGASAAAFGPNVYFFGGISPGGQFLSQIVEFNVLTRTSSVVPIPLPTARANTAAVSDGLLIYVIGGDSAGGNLDSILVFDPLTRAITTAPARLPEEANGIATVWTGTEILLFGGNLDGDTNTDRILKLRTLPTVSLVGADVRLPAPLGGLSAAWDPIRRVAHVFGGHDALRSYDTVLRFSPALLPLQSDEIEERPVTLPTARYHTRAAWVLDGAYVIGGVEDSGDTSQYMVKYTA